MVYNGSIKCMRNSVYQALFSVDVKPGPWTGLGCRQSLRISSGLIPDTPYNLVVAISEKRPYHDSSGELVIPSSYSNAHYHVVVWCISRVEPTFHPSMLKIPTNIAGQLGEHKSFLFSQLELMV